MHTQRKSSRNNRLRHIDELDAQLSSLLHEVRFIANLSDMQPPQLLDVNSQELTALLGRIADGLQVAQGLARKMWQSK